MGLYQNIYIGPYLEVAAQKVEVREDLCRTPFHCINPSIKNGPYCSACGVNLAGAYVEPDGRIEGRYRYKLRPEKDPRDVIAMLDKRDIDSFAPGCDIPPEFDHETKSFKEESVKRLTLIPNRGNWGTYIHDRANHVIDQTDLDIEAARGAFVVAYTDCIEALSKNFQAVWTRYGVVITWG